MGEISEGPKLSMGNDGGYGRRENNCSCTKPGKVKLQPHSLSVSSASYSLPASASAGVAHAAPARVPRFIRAPPVNDSRFIRLNRLASFHFSRLVLFAADRSNLADSVGRQ